LKSVERVLDLDFVKIMMREDESVSGDMRHSETRRGRGEGE
jgi:hypothetical protein